ncbi:hypothetical protein ACIBAC_11370 [Streptomyces sp. NPDC051362]|uniref:hypothetical protein n=1 Tax=Streptomyces sp. NPDC051362 TaxID=3365651 RepID=UPI003797A725
MTETTPADARAAIARVLALHSRDSQGRCSYCTWLDDQAGSGLDVSYPCDTVRAATVPAPAPADREAVCICGHSEAQHFEDACITEITGCDCGDFLTGEAAREVIARWRAAASGPGRADGETQQNGRTTADKAYDHGLTDTEYRAQSHAAAVAAVRAAIPGMYAHVAVRLEDVLNEGGETQQDETQAEPEPRHTCLDQTTAPGRDWDCQYCSTLPESIDVTPAAVSQPGKEA